MGYEGEWISHGTRRSPLNNAMSGPVKPGSGNHDHLAMSRRTLRKV